MNKKDNLSPFYTTQEVHDEKVINPTDRNPIVYELGHSGYIENTLKGYADCGGQIEEFWLEDGKLITKRECGNLALVKDVTMTNTHMILWMHDPYEPDVTISYEYNLS